MSCRVGNTHSINVMEHQKLFAIMSGVDRSAKAHLMRLGLSCAEPFYRCATGVRNKLFDWGIRKTATLPRPTISVGNITTGGTGKTPMVIALAKKLLAMGEKPAILLRGYAANEGEQSDEASLLRTELGDAVPVVASPSRRDAATRLIEENSAITTFILDDGFQHRQVARDLNIVLIDATQPFGFNHVLPRGLLREGKFSLRRADAVILTRCEQEDGDFLRELGDYIELLTDHQPAAHVASTWKKLRDANNVESSLDMISTKRVLGVCGIGNPLAFTAMLAGQCEQVEPVEFADHHPYQSSDLENLINQATKSNCDAIVTTEKDWVKWRKLWPTLNASIPVYRPILEIQFNDGEDVIDELIQQCVNS